jgi:tripartite-type tricarboxylate transporter receptor subunit TctC
VPTVAQTLPGYEVEGWIGLHAPAGTPRPIIERVDGIIQKALTDDEVRKGLEGRGMVVSAMDSRAMRSFVAEDVKRWAQWVSIAGIVPQ